MHILYKERSLGGDLMDSYMKMHPYMNFYPYPTYYTCPHIYHSFYERYARENRHDQTQLAFTNQNINKPSAMMDVGKQPLVVDIEDATENNTSFRTALWTGDYFQVTLMSIGVGDDIGLELHPDVDQFLRIEEGEGLVQMGKDQDNLTFKVRASEDDAIIVPAGMWHNLRNIGTRPLKLYSIYAPPEHPHGTVHRTKAEALEAEEDHY